MRLGEKLAHLRHTEGHARGLGRALTKAEVVRLMKQDHGASLSHAYLCQLESGARTHLTQHSRALLARFFHVHPGYLVNDPEPSPEASGGDTLRAWLRRQAAAIQHDPLVQDVFTRLAAVDDPRIYFRVLDSLLDLPPPDVRQMLIRSE